MFEGLKPDQKKSYDYEVTDLLSDFSEGLHFMCEQLPHLKANAEEQWEG